MIYLPGHPSTTQYVRKLLLISAGIERSTIMYLTAKHYGEVIAELDAQYADAMLDPTRPAPWHQPGRENDFVIGNDNPPKSYQLHVINAGTDDQRVVNMMNQNTLGAIDYKPKMEKLRVA